MWRLSTTLTINRPHTEYERDFDDKARALRYIRRMARAYKRDGWMVTRRRGELGFVARIDHLCCGEPFVMQYQAEEV